MNYIISRGKGFNLSIKGSYSCHLRSIGKAGRDFDIFGATLWTSQANHSYLSYTIHFVDKKWNLDAFC